MKKYFYILIPIFLGLVIYSILPQNKHNIISDDEDSEIDNTIVEGNRIVRAEAYVIEDVNVINLDQQ